MHWWKRADKLTGRLLCSVFFLYLACGQVFSQSVLSQGAWYKVAVTQTGVHRIDWNLLRKMGIDPGSVAPGQLQLFGNGGAMLPQENAAGKTADLTENAIWVSGEQDGKFDQGDAIYFYAESPHKVLYDPSKNSLTHELHPYSDTTYYFLTFGQRAGLRISDAPVVNSQKPTQITAFDDYWYYEKESYNLLKSGRDWWGDYLAGANTWNMDVNLPGIIAGSEVKFTGSAIGAAQVPTSFIWYLNGQQIGEKGIGTVRNGTYDVRGLRADATFTVAAPAGSGNLKVGVSYNKDGQSSAQGYLNYIGLQVKRELRFYDNQQVYLFTSQKADTVKYQFQGDAAGWMIWDVTNTLKPGNIPVPAGAALTINARQQAGLSKYIGFKPGQAFEPAGWKKVANQNLAKSDTPDLLIITPAAWQNEAKRLAAFRTANDQLETLVATTEQVYNEFASGAPDVTAIRNFARLLHDRSPGKLKYLLLFGDATFDYKNLYKNQTASQKGNWVPVYESRESLNPIYTYSSDDYYGFLEDSEGAWIESTAGDHTLDVGIGRLPVKSAAEAKTIVDKLIRYESAKGKGNWRNDVTFVADDGDGNIHQEHADQLARLIEGKFIPSRLFIDAFRQSAGAEGPQAPAVNTAIRNAISNGTLILNYTGHGGTSGWAEEQVLTLADMQAARGIDNLPLLFTATCDFGRYDDPGTVSGAELMVLSPRGAAIGAISTTRPVYSSTNFTLSKAFYEALIEAPANARMGDFIRQTKNNALVGSLNRNFAFLGDPSMRLARARNQVRWVSLPDTLRAMQKVKLAGEIVSALSSNRAIEFQGTAHVTIYDKEGTFKTLGNQSEAEAYATLGNKLFDGHVSVDSGRFVCEFIVPKNIDLDAGTGRASIYAVNADSTDDASAQLPLIVGGAGTSVEENIPPQITAYLNDESFKDGDVVTPSAVFLAKVRDESGINLLGQGYDITLTLNDTLTIILNDYFTADLDDYTSGLIRYPFDNLPTGKYSARLKVWDTYTNFSEIAFGFQVSEREGIRLQTFRIYPNPFESDLSFELSHDRANEDLELTLNVLLLNGQRLGTFRWQYYNSESTIRETINAFQLGSWVPRYMQLLYQLSVRALKDNTKDTRSGRLIRVSQ